MSTDKSVSDTKISARVKKIRKISELSQTSFAKSLGIKQPTLSEIEKGVYPPSDSAIRLIVSQYRVNRAWLETGEGEMFREDAQGASNGESGNHLPAGYIQIPFYDVQTNTEIVCEKIKQSVDFLLFKEDWIRNVLRTLPKNMVQVLVTGDSMEPTLSDGDIVLVDTSDMRLGFNGLYVLQYQDTIQVKRLQKQTDTVLILSDNSVYSTETIEIDRVDDLNIVGRVRWRGKKG